MTTAIYEETPDPTLAALAARSEPDYDRPYTGTPAEGQFVEFEHAGQTLCGVVIDTLIGCLGILLAVRVSPGRTIDIHWQRVRACEMPADWADRFAPAK